MDPWLVEQPDPFGASEGNPFNQPSQEFASFDTSFGNPFAPAEPAALPQNTAQSNGVFEAGAEFEVTKAPEFGSGFDNTSWELPANNAPTFTFDDGPADEQHSPIKQEQHQESAAIDEDGQVEASMSTVEVVGAPNDGRDAVEASFETDAFNDVTNSATKDEQVVFDVSSQGLGASGTVDEIHKAVDGAGVSQTVENIAGEQKSHTVGPLEVDQTALDVKPPISLAPTEAFVTPVSQHTVSHSNATSVTTYEVDTAVPVVSTHNDEVEPIAQANTNANTNATETTAISSPEHNDSSPKHNDAFPQHDGVVVASPRVPASTPRHESHATPTQPIASPSYTDIAMSFSSAQTFQLPPLAALATPPAPVATLSTIDSITVGWSAVEGASGYYCDYEGRTVTGVDAPTAAEGVWLGNGGRVVVNGSALLNTTKCKISGLQKNSIYVVRVTAVKKREVVLPDGTKLEQTVESEPSAPSKFIRTLNPRAEIARLTDTNAYLTAENERIPVLEASLVALENTRQAEVSALTDELNTTQEQLSTAVMEIDKLQVNLSSKIRELDAANAEIKTLNHSLQVRSGELGEARAEGRHLRDVIASKSQEITRDQAEIQRLNEMMQSLVADKERTLAEASRLDGVIAERDKDIAQLKARIADLESQLQAKEKSRQDLANRVASQSQQLSTLSSDKDVVINKLTEDLGKVMGELQRVQNQLHKAQDMVAYLEPHARIVLDLRERQAAWDAAHEGASAIGSPFGKMSAARKLGPRPTLTL